MKKNTHRGLVGRVVSSPVGELTLLASENGLAGVYFEQRCREDWVEGSSPFLEQAETELAEYFVGERKEFGLPFDLVGTEFQLSVWKALQSIGYAQRMSYGELAQQIGNPKAVRAVGLANGANPVSIVVPCHRVIGADGSLTGYGGGLERKKTLLTLEDGFIDQQFCLKNEDA